MSFFKKVWSKFRAGGRVAKTAGTKTGKVAVAGTKKTGKVAVAGTKKVGGTVSKALKKAKEEEVPAEDPTE